MKKEFLGRGWAWPFRIDPATGAVATSVAEDSIRQSMTLILGTRPGERQMMPEFGCRVHELVYTPNTQANASLIAYHVQQALVRWEPRVDVLEVKADSSTGGKVAVTVRYRIRSTLAESVIALDVPVGA